MMKFSLVAVIVALLCATVVTAAPSTPNLSFEELALANSFGFDDQLRDYWLNIKCVREILEQETSPAVKQLWLEYKGKLAKLHEVEWTKCKGISNIAEQQRCKATVLEHEITMVSEFFKKLVKVADFNKVREIRKMIAEKCLKVNTFDEDDEPVEELSSNLHEQFQCLLDVLAEVSKSNGLGELWTKRQPELQRALDTWKKCTELENKLSQFLCGIKRGLVTYRLINEYLREITSKKPAIVNELVHQLQEKCSSYKSSTEDLLDLDDLEYDELSNNLLEKLKCYSEAITDGLKETDFAKPWDKLRSDLRKLADRVQACKKQSSLMEIAKCVAKEAEGAKGIMNGFLTNLKKVNKEAHDRVMKNIRERCK